jgi:hypothetical protein
MPSVRLLVLAIAIAAAVPRRADAAEPGAMTWAVSVDPSCGRHAAHFAREVDLACDAVGHSCQVVSTGAERRAILACPKAEQWTLEARSGSGVRLWTVALVETKASRLRVAAMWLARAERDAPPPNAPVIAGAAPPAIPTPAKPEERPASPPRTPTAVTPAPAPASASATAPAPPSAPATATAANAPPAPAPGASAPPANAPTATPTPRTDGGPSAADRAPATGPSPSRHGGVALALRGALGGDLAPESVGGSARVAIGLPLRAYAGAVITGERAIGAASGYDFTLGRAGAAIGWGAPWSDDDLFGASVDAGAALGYLQAPGGVAPGSRTFVQPYAQLSVFGRWRTRGAVRPGAALSVAALADPVRVSEANRDVATLPRASAALDIGVAWAAW